MLLSHKTTIHVNEEESNLLGHMCYAAYKLWNVCNYERRHVKELELKEYPDWYYQKKAHKDDLWYKSLPSQTAQEICKLLDKSWKSFYKLQETGGIKNPRPPRFKQDKIPITYMQNGMKHTPGEGRVRLSLPRQLVGFMKDTYGISAQFVTIENQIFECTDIIKQIKIYPPREDGTTELIVIYESKEPEFLPDNGRYLSIDLGLHNLMSCYDNQGKGFIVGRQYLAICQRYDQEIARLQSQWGKIQASHGVKYPKPSAHVLKLYKKKRDTVHDYLHKMTHYVVEYCKKEEIHTVVVGDITGIREDKDLGHVTNQKLHSLPYRSIYIMLEYKLAMEGIRFIKQEESYTSQCSPMAKTVGKRTAEKSQRVKRGLYKEGKSCYNADMVGAYNILRKHLKGAKREAELPLTLSSPTVIKVAV